jgi:hypothetical protein
MIKEFSTDTTDKSLHIRILPRASWGNRNFLDAHIADTLLKRGAVNAITIPHEIAWRFVPRKRLDDLLRRPLSGTRLDAAGHDGFLGQDRCQGADVWPSSETSRGLAPDECVVRRPHGRHDAKENSAPCSCPGAGSKPLSPRRSLWRRSILSIWSGSASAGLWRSSSD